MPRMTYSRQWESSSHSIRLVTFLSITVALILVVPIALASPPDPSWVAGIYDGADNPPFSSSLMCSHAAAALPVSTFISP